MVRTGGHYMIERFSELKKDLTELATVLNQFKSEAVQLRLLELLFDTTPKGNAEEPKDDVGPKRRANGRANKRGSKTPAKKAAEGSPSEKPKKGAGGKGANATLTNLLAGEFFNKHKTIGDIIDHSKLNLARDFKANEFSGKLARLIRSGELTRKKNADGQYEYKKT